jgi:hypothetical protein
MTISWTTIHPPSKAKPSKTPVMISIEKWDRIQEEQEQEQDQDQEQEC